MNDDQALVSIFGLLCLTISGWAVWRVARSSIRYKAAWIIGSLFGFVGIGLNWNQSDHLIFLFGVGIPPVQIFKVMPFGPIIVKTMFPIVAPIALARCASAQEG